MRHGPRAVAVRKYSKPALKQCSGQEEEILFQDIWWLKSTNTPAKLTGIDVFMSSYGSEQERCATGSSKIWTLGTVWSDAVPGYIIQ